MAKSIGGFLHHLMMKSGMNTDDQNIKDFMANSELAKTEIPDYIEKGIDNQLVSIKDALNNHSVIKNFYRRQTLDSIDETLLGIIEEEGDDELKTRLSNISSSFQRIPELVKSIKEKEAKKLNASKPDKPEIQKEIDRLHQELKIAQEANVKQKTEFEKSLKGVQLNYALDKKLMPYKTIFDTLDPEVKATSIKNLINKELQDNKLSWAFDDSSNAISLLKEDGTSYYGDNHQLITPESFIEKTLSRNKLLITTTKAPEPSGDTNGRQQPKNANGTSTKNATLSHLTQQALADINASQAAIGV